MIGLEVRGVSHAFHLLTGVAGRLRDQSPVWEDGIADSVLGANQRWWLTRGGGSWPEPHEATGERDARGSGRDPRQMFESGELHDAATRRGARGQVLDARPTFLFLGVDLLQGFFQAHAGRESLADLDARDHERHAEQLADFFLTGRTHG